MARETRIFVARLLFLKYDAGRVAARWLRAMPPSFLRDGVPLPDIVEPHPHPVRARVGRWE
jgi:hypothetical protein